MSSWRKRRRADGHCLAPTKQSQEPSTDRIMAGLVNSAAVTVGGVYELTGSPLMSTVAGGLTVTIVGLAVGFRR